MKRRPWTTSEHKTVNYHYGFTPLATLARALGRTENAVRMYARKLGLEGHNGRFTRRTVDRARLRTLIEAGHSSTEIAQMIGTDPRNVRRIATRELSGQHMRQLRANGRARQRTKNNSWRVAA